MKEPAFSRWNDLKSVSYLTDFKPWAQDKILRPSCSCDVLLPIVVIILQSDVMDRLKDDEHTGPGCSLSAFFCVALSHSDHFSLLPSAPPCLQFYFIYN